LFSNKQIAATPRQSKKSTDKTEENAGAVTKPQSKTQQISKMENLAQLEVANSRLADPFQSSPRIYIQIAVRKEKI